MVKDGFKIAEKFDIQTEELIKGRKLTDEEKEEISQCHKESLEYVLRNKKW